MTRAQRGYAYVLSVAMLFWAASLLQPRTLFARPEDVPPKVQEAQVKTTALEPVLQKAQETHRVAAITLQAAQREARQADTIIQHKREDANDFPEALSRFRSSLAILAQNNAKTLVDDLRARINKADEDENYRSLFAAATRLETAHSELETALQELEAALNAVPMEQSADPKFRAALAKSRAALNAGKAMQKRIQTTRSAIGDESKGEIKRITTLVGTDNLGTLQTAFAGYFDYLLAALETLKNGIPALDPMADANTLRNALLSHIDTWTDIERSLHTAEQIVQALKSFDETKAQSVQMKLAEAKAELAARSLDKMEASLKTIRAALDQGEDSTLQKLIKALYSLGTADRANSGVTILASQNNALIVEELRRIEEKWNAFYGLLQMTRPKDETVAKIQSAMMELRVAAGLISAALDLIEEGLAGNMEKFVTEQIRLFYFSNTVELIRILNRRAALFNPESQERKQRAEERRQNLRRAELLFLEAQGKVSDYQNEVVALRQKIQQQTAQANDAIRQANNADALLELLNGRKSDLENRKSALTNDQTALEQKMTAPEYKPDPRDQAKKRQLERQLKALDPQLKRAEADAQTQQKRRDQADADRATAEERLADLQNEQAALPAALKNAETQLKAAQEEVRRQRREVLMEVENEVAAFASARDTPEIYYAPARADSADPARRVLLYAFKDSNTIYVRGNRTDVEKVKEMIAEFDRPAPQARITLWTLQLSGTGSKPLNRALAHIEKELSDLRGRIARSQDLLRNAISAEVARVAGDTQKALVSYSCDLPPLSGRIARTMFYAPEIRQRLGYRLPVPDMEARLLYMEAERDLNMAFEIFDQAANLKEHGRSDQRRPIPGLIMQVEYMIKESQNCLNLADVFLKQNHLSGVSAVGSKQNQTLAAKVNALKPEVDRLLSQIAPDRVKLRSANSPDEFLRLLHTCKLRESLLANDPGNWRGKVVPLLPLTGNIVCPDKTQAQEVLRSTEAVTSYTLPDPANMTTLGQMIFVLSLGKRTSRERILMNWYMQMRELWEGVNGKDNRFLKARIDVLLKEEQRLVRNGASPLLGTLTFPKIVFGSSLGESVRDEELTNNQEEILLALETKARASVAEEIQNLIKRVSKLTATPYLQERGRRVYLPLLGWLQGYSYNALPNGKATQDSETSWYQVGLEAVDAKDVKAFQSDIQDYTADRIAATQLMKNPLSKATGRVAAADDMIKRMVTAAEDDMDRFFIQPALENIRDRINRRGVELGTIQRESILATNRLVARVDPRATAQLEAPAEENVLEAATQLGSLLQGVERRAAEARKTNSLLRPNDAGGLGSGALLNGVVGGVSASLAQAGTLASVGTGLLSLLSSLSTQPSSPPGEIYSIGSGNTFKVTPIFDPSGQALRFKFDFVAATQIREPDGTTNRQLPRIERHSVNTEVQLSNLELREISRFETNSKIGVREQRTGGVPFLNQVPLIKEIPIIGYFTRKGGSAAVAQQSLILGQTTLYPTIADIVDLLVESASKLGIGELDDETANAPAKPSK